jgi:hypothetical protein
MLGSFDIIWLDMKAENETEMIPWKLSQITQMGIMNPQGG